jgi:hypothetical protein
MIATWASPDVVDDSIVLLRLGEYTARCLPIPGAMSFEQAAGFMVAYGTSHVALAHRARLAAGQTLLVLGAAGGVGLTAVEIGAQLGARVVAVARGADKLAVAERAGAMLHAYTQERPLTAPERALLPALLRAGALRFWISRLWDYHLPRQASMLKPHDPTHFERVLRERSHHPMTLHDFD